jgi:uncharacterized membrane protein YqhA
MFYVATVDTIDHLRPLVNYWNPASRPSQHEDLRVQTIGHVVEAIDGYLLGMVMLIFAFGLYELFIGRIDAAESNDRASRLLLIHSLDDLKERLAQVVLLMLVIKFFEHAFRRDFTQTIDLVYLAIGILLVSGALFLSHQMHQKSHPN